MVRTNLILGKPEDIGISIDIPDACPRCEAHDWLTLTHRLGTTIYAVVCTGCGLTANVDTPPPHPL